MKIIEPLFTYILLLLVQYGNTSLIFNGTSRGIYWLSLMILMSSGVFYLMTIFFIQYIKKYGTKIILFFISSLLLFIANVFIPQDRFLLINMISPQDNSLTQELWNACFPVFVLAHILMFFIIVKRKVYHQC